MEFLKSLLRGLLSLVFKCSIVLLAVIGSFAVVFGTSAQLKKSLRTSNIYTGAADSIIDSTRKSTGNKSDAVASDASASSPFDDPELRQAAQKAITPAFLQSSSEQIIDGMYGWISGKTAQPEFRIDASAAKAQFTEAVGDYAVNRAGKLPACTLDQTRELAATAGKIDPLTISCVPAGFDIHSLRNLVATQVDKTETGKDSILKNPIITQDNLPKDDQGKTAVQHLTESASSAPRVFHLFTTAPTVFGVLAVLSGGLIVLLHDQKRRGLRSLAITLTVVGVLILLGIGLSKATFNKLESPTGPFAKNVTSTLQQPAVKATHALIDAVNSKLLLYAIIYLLVGVGTLVTLHTTKPKVEESGPSNSATPA